MAEYKGRANRLPDRTDEDRGERVFPAQPVAEYAGHSDGVPANWRPRRFYDAPYTGGYSGSELWHIWTGIRIVRWETEGTGSRRVSGFRKVSTEALGSRFT